MNDIIKCMQVKRKPFVELLDEKTAKIDAIWKAVSQDYDYSIVGDETYCRSCFAFTGTLNARKDIPQGFKDRTCESQKNLIVERLKRYCNKKRVTVLLYWELTTKLALHCHGVIIGYPALVDKISKWWKRNLGFTYVKAIDNPSKWKEYCIKDLYRNGYLPTILLPSATSSLRSLS